MSLSFFGRLGIICEISSSITSGPSRRITAKSSLLDVRDRPAGTASAETIRGSEEAWRDEDVVRGKVKTVEM